MKKICLKTWSVLCGILFTLTLQAQSFSISPMEAIPGKIVKISIKSNMGSISRDSSCFVKNNQCPYIGNYIYFSTGDFLGNQKVKIQNFTLITTDSAEIILQIPNTIGKYNVSTIGFNYQNLGVFRIGNPYKTFTITPNTTYQNNELKVTITGNNTKIVKGNTCASDSNCRSFGSTLYYSSASSTVKGSLPIKSYTQIDDYNAELTFLSPQSVGNYYLSSINLPVNTDNTTGVFSSNTLNVLRKNFIIETPNNYENNTVKVTIKGFNVKIGQGSSCMLNTGCIDLGTTISFYKYDYDYDYTTPLGTFNLKNFLQINDTTAEALVTLPKAGNYYLKTANGLIGYLYVQKPNISITPNIVKLNVNTRFRINANGIFIGNDTDCGTDTLCKKIGNYITTPYGNVPILSYERIDNNIIEGYFKFSNAGQYSMTTQTGLNLGYINVVEPSFTFTPNIWQENVPIKARLTGYFTKLGKGAICQNDSNCSLIGDSLFFSTNNNSIVVKQKISSFTQINDTVVEISFLAPSKGSYYLSTGKGLVSKNLLLTEANTAQIYGTSSSCKLSEANAFVYFTGLPPWNIKYTDGVNNFEVKNIKSNQYTIKVNPIININYVLKEVSNPYGVGTVSGSARFTVNSDTAARAYLSRVDSATNNLNIKFKIELKGKAPWQIYMNIGSENDTSFTVSTSPYFLSIKPKSFTTFKINYVIDNSFCGNGTAYGSVNYAPGDIVTDLNSFDYTLQTNIYPNPTTGIVNLENAISATLFNSLGEEILKTSGTKIDISHVPNGLYYIQALDAKNKLSSVKIVKE